MSEPNIGELLTTTLQNQSDAFADAVSDNVALYNVLKRKGLIKKEPGGADLREPIMHAENGTAGFYTGYEPIDITPQRVLDVAKFSWKQASVTVTASGLELRQNADSKYRLFDLLASRVEVAKKSIVNLVEESLFSDGTGHSGKEFTGLRAHVSTTPTSGTHGGINRATWTFWQNRADTYSTIDAASVKTQFNEQMTALSRGSDKVDLILAGDDIYNYLMEACQAIQQFSGESELAKIGFTAMKFRGAEVVHCGGIGGQIPAGYVYFLNSGTFAMRVHKDMWMNPLPGGDRVPTDQDAIIKPIGLMGNLTMNNAKLNGVLYQA